MNDEQRQKRISKARMRVLFHVPFYAPGVAKLPVEFVDPKEIDTAATNGERIVWNREWFDTLEDKVLPTVLCHEVAHCMLGHLWRAPAGCDWDRWNQATDHAVNLMLKEFGEQVTAKNMADPFPFPDPQDAYCADPAFKGLAEEVIYGRIPKGNPGGGNKPGKGGGGKGKPGKGSMPSFGQMQKPAGAQADPTAQRKIASDWQNTLQQAVAMAKGRGDVPGSVTRYIDELLHPEVPWYELVRRWLCEKANDDWNWMKPNTYFDESGFILPSLDSEKVGQMVFATDSSGSTHCEPLVLQHFRTEKQNCLDELKPSKLTDIMCDTRITSIHEYRLGDTIDPEVKGGGGTDFRPVFEHVAEFEAPPKCLVYLTDLDGTFPDGDPGYPVLWVVFGCAGDKKAPFGETLRIK